VEFRGVWLSVDNIDWPTKPTPMMLRTKLQFVKLLDMHKQNGMKVVVQVRPATDALYPSVLEPWSHRCNRYARGKPHYDPPEFGDNGNA
jgi:uncharacterized lipoprotein YddW (UPF0748 family)